MNVLNKAQDSWCPLSEFVDFLHKELQRLGMWVNTIPGAMDWAHPTKLLVQIEDRLKKEGTTECYFVFVRPLWAKDPKAEEYEVCLHFGGAVVKVTKEGFMVSTNDQEIERVKRTRSSTKLS